MKKAALFSAGSSFLEKIKMFILSNPYTNQIIWNCVTFSSIHIFVSGTNKPDAISININDDKEKDDDSDEDINDNMNVNDDEEGNFSTDGHISGGIFSVQRPKHDQANGQAGATSDATDGGDDIDDESHCDSFYSGKWQIYENFNACNA